MTWRKGRRLKLVTEHDARDRTAEIFCEVRQLLGLPHVNLVFQAFAAYPVFLDLHWQAMRSVLESQEFFALAERLGADAYTRVHNYLAVPDLNSQLSPVLDPAERQQLLSVADLFQYQNPLLLILVATQFQAFESLTGTRRRLTQPAVHPSYAEAPVLLSEEDAPPGTRRIYEDLKRTLKLSFVSPDYRAFACWPEFLKSYWDALKPVAQSALYEGAQNGITETAHGLAREIPEPVELTATQLSEGGLSGDEVASVVGITEMFLHALSGLLLNVAFAKIALEGGNRRAQRSGLEPTAAHRAA